MHDPDFGPAPHKKRCRTSKKKRLRIKKRASLEPKVCAVIDELSNQNSHHQAKSPSKSPVKEQKANNFHEQDDEQQERDQKKYAPVPVEQQKQLQTDEIPSLKPIQDHDENDDNNREKNGQDEHSDMTDYERRRRENILRNQAFLRRVGVSTAKLAARTSIGNEAEKEERRKELAARRVVAEARKAELLSQPVRKSRRLQREKVVANERKRLLKFGAGVRATGKTGTEVNVRLKPVDNRSVKTLAFPQREKADQMKKVITAHIPTRKTESAFRWKEFDAEAPVQASGFQRGKVEDRPRAVMDVATLRDVISLRVILHHATAPRYNAETPVGIQPQDTDDALSNEQANDHDEGHEKLTSNDGQVGEHEEMGHLAEYEQKRQENILRNQAFMRQLGVSAAKFATRTAIGIQKEAKKQRVARSPESANQPVRKSRRTSGGKEDLGHPKDRDLSMDLLTLKTARQHHSGRVHFFDGMAEDGKEFLTKITRKSNMVDVSAQTQAFLDDDDVEFTVESRDTAKVMTEPIRAMAFLPRTDRIVVACGDKEGHVTLWVPSNGDETIECGGFGSSAAFYGPHSFTVSQLIFPDSTRLISSSFDGTVRELDLWTTESTLVCDTEDAFGISSLVASGNPQFYYAGCGDGTLRLIDYRVRKFHGISYALHNAGIRTLDQHPSLDFCIATASIDNTVCLWDKRKISFEKNKPLVTLHHKGSVNCAYFSPHDGAWLLTSEENSFVVNTFDTSSLTQHNTQIAIPKPTQMRHRSWNSYATLPRPAWDPKRRNRFVIGGLHQPQQIQIFRAGNPEPIRQLTSSNVTRIAPINVFHPQLDLIASGHNSGLVSLWRGKSK